MKVVSGQDHANTVIGHIDTRRIVTKIRFSQWRLVYTFVIELSQHKEVWGNLLAK
jgi:hypothetical protein